MWVLMFVREQSLAPQTCSVAEEAKPILVKSERPKLLFAEEPGPAFLVEAATVAIWAAKTAAAAAAACWQAG